MVCAVAGGTKAMGEEMNEAELERVKLYNQMYLEYNKLVIENSMRAQRGLLLCHGGAITAIVMSGKAWLLPYALFFGLGAILAVLCCALGYAANFRYMASWAVYIKALSMPEIEAQEKKGSMFHRWAIASGAASGACFLFGLIGIWLTL